MSQVFISYSRQDHHFALFVQTRLESFGYDVWIDTKGIVAGTKWVDEIEKAIRESDSFIVIITPSACNSDMVNREIDQAIEHEKRIVPIILDGNPPDKLSGYQWIDLRVVLDKLKRAFPIRSDQAILEKLREQIKDPSPDNRVRALHMIESLMAADHPVPHQLLLSCLEDEDPRVRQEAARALGVRGQLGP